MPLNTMVTAAHPQRIAGHRSTARPVEPSRRSFLGGTVAASCAAVGTMPTGGLFAAGDQRLRVGLIGCGGRGTGAALQALEADPAVRVVAIGDRFADQVLSSAEVLGHRAGDRFDCPPARCFVGPESYRGVIESGVDLVLLAAPPHVRPLHLEAAVAAGKHVYCEKPVAIDVAGVVRAAAAAARSRAAGLALVSGFCFRRDPRTAELVTRIHDGAIGRPRSVQTHAAIGLPWRKPLESGREPGEWPLANWISFARFSGGHFVEQHVQAIDRAAWILGDLSPVFAEPIGLDTPTFLGSARGTGSPSTGAIGDCAATTAVRYTFADGQTIEASIDRRERACDRIVEVVTGSTGSCDLVRGTMAGRRQWATESKPGPARYRITMETLVGGILSGNVAHDGASMCRSTLLAVMGRMASETGRPVAWNGLAGRGSHVA
jgi:predicted dehydrogenase